jgi:predicted transcriptional regulator
MQDKTLYNIWEIYGLKSDPFNTNPLLVFGGEIPLNTFMGRTRELKRLNNLFRNKGGSRVVVSGDIGVGKTSFVNYSRALAQKHKFFTTIKEIAIQPDWTSIDFIINTLGAIYVTIERKEDFKLPNELRIKLESLIAIIEIKNISISGSTMGFGAGGGKTTTRHMPSKLTMPMLQNLFEDIIDAIKKEKYEEIILHYNNLELFEQEDLTQLFQRIRDFIQTKNVHYVFVGGLIVPSTIQSIPRVSSVFSDTPIILPNLSLEEIETIIEKRINCLAIKDITTGVSIGEGVIKVLYELYEGNLRCILNSLSTVFRETTKEIPVKLTVHKLRKVLSDVVKEKWLDKLTSLEQKTVFVILKTNEITNKELSQRLKKHPQNVSKITNKLLDLCVIRIKKKEGREKYFAADPSLKWFLLEDMKEDKKDINEKEIQKLIKEFLK